ncbi:MAG: hypothetical protein ACRDHE_14735, partial [Ktedonobacterales bacterium]
MADEREMARFGNDRGGGRARLAQGVLVLDNDETPRLSVLAAGRQVCGLNELMRTVVQDRRITKLSHRQHGTHRVKGVYHVHHHSLVHYRLRAPCSRRSDSQPRVDIGMAIIPAGEPARTSLA